MKFIFKSIGWVGIIIFLYPFYLPLINKIPDVSWELYTYGLEVKDFMIVWVAVGGILGLLFNIILTQKRISVQEQLLYLQEEQYVRQIEQQYKRFNELNEKQNKQLQIQDKQSRDHRFSLGVELLGNPNESARIGGAFNIYFLATEYKEYRKPACEIFCAHIRTFTNKQEYKISHTEKPSNEIQTIIDLLFRKEYGLYFDNCNKNFSGALLNGISFFEAILVNVDFKMAALSNINFSKAKLNSIDFKDAKLSKVNFESTIFSDVNFFRATLNNVDFEFATLNNITFSFATFLENIDFTGTVLANVPLKEIVRPNRSLDLTKPQAENK